MFQVYHKTVSQSFHDRFISDIHSYSTGQKESLVYFNPICTGGGKFAPLLSYFIIAPKQKQSFALMHPDFESNLITHIFRKFGVSQTIGSDVIFAFVRGT